MLTFFVSAGLQDYGRYSRVLLQFCTVYVYVLEFKSKNGGRVPVAMEDEIVHAQLKKEMISTKRRTRSRLKVQLDLGALAHSGISRRHEALD